MTEEQQKDFDETFKMYVEKHFRGSAEEAAALRSVAITWYIEGIQFASRDIIRDAEKFHRETKEKYLGRW